MKGYCILLDLGRIRSKLLLLPAWVKCRLNYGASSHGAGPLWSAGDPTAYLLFNQSQNETDYSFLTSMPIQFASSGFDLWYLYWRPDVNGLQCTFTSGYLLSGTFGSRKMETYSALKPVRAQGGRWVLHPSVQGEVWSFQSDCKAHVKTRPFIST